MDTIPLLYNFHVDVDKILNRSIMFPDDYTNLKKYIYGLHMLQQTIHNDINTPQQHISRETEINTFGQSENEMMKPHIQKCHDELFDLFKPSEVDKQSRLVYIDELIKKNDDDNINHPMNTYESAKNRLVADKYMTMVDHNFSTKIAENLSHYVCDSI